MAGRRSVVWQAAGWAALFLATAAGCSGGPEKRLNIGAGVGLADLPPEYSIVVGRVCVTVENAPLLCTYAQGDAACGLAVAYGGRHTLLIPHQSESRALGLGAEPDPFFVVRLPKGSYEVTHFESSVQSVPARFNKARGEVVPIRKRFSVGEKEIVYVGSLFVDIPRNGGGRPSVRVEDEADRAREVVSGLGAAPANALAVRLMGD